MTRRIAQNDVICVAVPDEVDASTYVEELTRLAWVNVRNQWSPYARITLETGRIDWLITNRIEDVDTFQPAHDCPQCHIGNDRARDYLTGHPGATIAMANIDYTEVWPDYDYPRGMPAETRAVVERLLDGDWRIPMEMAVKLVTRKVTAEVPQPSPRKWAPI